MASDLRSKSRSSRRVVSRFGLVAVVGRDIDFGVALIGENLLKLVAILLTLKSDDFRP